MGHRERESGARRHRCGLELHCKQKPDPETQIGSFHSCPNKQRSVHKVRQECREPVCKREDVADSRDSSGLLFNKLQSPTLKAPLFPTC